MKIAVITDTHYGVNNDNPAFYEYMRKTNEQFFKVIDEQEIKHVLHLGDLFDRRKYVNFVTAKHCREDLIEPLVKRGLDIHVLAGNHDTFYKDTSQVNSLVELIGPKYPNLDIILGPKELEFDGTKIVLIPWINDENQQETFDFLKQTTAQVVMGHLAINGFQMDGGFICETGISPSIFQKFDVVASGHFHHPSRIDNIQYIGASYEKDWSDWNDPRGFSIFDTKTRTFTFHRNTETMYYHTRYDDTKDDLIKKQLSESDFSEYTNRYVKLTIINKTNLQLFELFCDKINEAKPVKFSVIEPTSLTDEENVTAIDQTQDTPTILSTYVDELGLTVDNTRLKKLMTDTYYEAQSLENVE